MNKLRLRQVAIMLIATLATLPLASCGGDEDEPIIPPQKPETPVTPTPDDDDDNGDDADGSESVFNQLIVGNWYDESRNYGLTFNSNGYGNDFIGYYTAVNDEFEWSITGKNLRLDWDFAATDILTIVKLDETTLIIDNHTFVRIDGSENGDPGTDPKPDDPNDGLVDPSGKDSDTFWANHKNRGEVSTTLSGSGTSASPYLITNAADLRFLSDQVRMGNEFSGKYFRLTADITINKGVLNTEGSLNQSGVAKFEQWIPIASYFDNNSTYFAGNFDGNNHTISGLYVKRTAKIYGGLFGRVSGTVKNVTIKDSYIETPVYAGAITGRAYGKSNTIVIENCHSYATVSAVRAGGVIGYIYQGNANMCSNHGNVYGSDRAGGITSFNQEQSGTSCILQNCVNTGSVSGNISTTGGISGSGAVIVNCVNSGTVTASKYAGGILGWDFGTPRSTGVYNCVNVGKVTSEFPAAIVAYVSSSTSSASIISYCYGLDFISGPLYNIIKVSSKDKFTNNSLLSDSEMRSAATISALNSRRKADYSEWVKGKDGYPTLSWATNL